MSDLQILVVMQQKMREERETKRATMDGRHDFILSTVATRLGMKQDDAEEFMLDGDQVLNNLVASCWSDKLLWLHKQLKEYDSFFASDGRSGLIFFYQPPVNKLVGEESAKPSTGTATPSYNANGRRLWITDGTVDEYTGTCLFFLRMSTAKPITMMNIHQVYKLYLPDISCYFLTGATWNPHSVERGCGSSKSNWDV